MPTHIKLIDGDAPYFDDNGQRDTIRRLARVTEPGGALVIGTHEQLPAGQPDFAAWTPQSSVFRRADHARAGSSSW